MVQCASSRMKIAEQLRKAGHVIEAMGRAAEAVGRAADQVAANADKATDALRSTVGRSAHGPPRCGPI